MPVGGGRLEARLAGRAADAQQPEEVQPEDDDHDAARPGQLALVGEQHPAEGRGREPSSRNTVEGRGRRRPRPAAPAGRAGPRLVVRRGAGHEGEVGRHDRQHAGREEAQDAGAPPPPGAPAGARRPRDRFRTRSRRRPFPARDPSRGGGRRHAPPGVTSPLTTARRAAVAPRHGPGPRDRRARPALPAAGAARPQGARRRCRRARVCASSPTIRRRAGRRAALLRRGRPRAPRRARTSRGPRAPS